MDSIVKREEFAVALRKEKRKEKLSQSRLRFQSKSKIQASPVESLAKIVSNPPDDFLELVRDLKNLFSVQDWL